MMTDSTRTHEADGFKHDDQQTYIDRWFPSLSRQLKRRAVVTSHIGVAFADGFNGALARNSTRMYASQRQQRQSHPPVILQGGFNTDFHLSNLDKDGLSTLCIPAARSLYGDRIGPTNPRTIRAAQIGWDFLVSFSRPRTIFGLAVSTFWAQFREWKGTSIEEVIQLHHEWCVKGGAKTGAMRTLAASKDEDDRSQVSSPFSIFEHALISVYSLRVGGKSFDRRKCEGG